MICIRERCGECKGGYRIVNTLERIKKLFLKNFDFPEERLQPEATIESIGLDSLDKV